MCKSINFISLGCAKNLVDSEKVIAFLEHAGFQVKFEDAKGSFTYVIINTCGFINDAKEESIDTILNYVKLKQQGRVKTIIVMGCLSQRYKQDLIREIPEIDAIFGVNDFTSLYKYLDISKHAPYYTSVRKLTTPPHYAYLKIAEGCNRQCAFCAIPAIRGSHTSYPIKALTAEAAMLQKAGVKELLIVAQDSTFYGMDLYGGRKLAELLEALSLINGIEWIRLNYTYPAHFPVNVLDTIAANKKICRYIDMPLQHISNNVLKAMQRGINKSQTLQLIEKIRHQLPGAAIRTSFIVGFPNETDKEFRELYDFVSETAFDRMGVFMYSHEEGTPAYQLKDTVPQAVKMERFEALMTLQQDISLQKNTQKIGQSLKVIIDSKNGNTYTGRTEWDAPEVDNEVLIETSSKLQCGNFYEVVIKNADAYTLYAELKSEKQ